ncbi:hypothetical protein TNCV_2862891 [Trichonephila clavipes]|nr:hypothetical protein TNCV_2862891 [Trichonephila clavipes]
MPPKLAPPSPNFLIPPTGGSISLDMLTCASPSIRHRGQTDLVDLRSTPDKNYKWVLNYQDHATNFGFLRPCLQMSF